MVPKRRLHAADSDDEDDGGEVVFTPLQHQQGCGGCSGEEEQEKGGLKRMHNEEASIYTDLAAFLTGRVGMRNGKGPSSSSDEGEIANRLRFFEDVMRFQEERLRIVRRYLTRSSSSSAMASPPFPSPTIEEAVAIASKLDALFSFENLLYMFEDVDEWSLSRQMMSALDLDSSGGRSPAPALLSSSSSTPFSSFNTLSSSSTTSSTTTSFGSLSLSDESLRQSRHRWHQHQLPKRQHTARRSMRRFDRLLQDLKNERREERTRAHLRRDEHYRALQEAVGSRLDASVMRTRVWSLRTCCAFAIFDHALDERSEYRDVLPSELNDYVNVVAFPRRFRRVRWVSVINRLAQRRPLTSGSSIGSTTTSGAAAAMAAGLGGGVAAAAAVAAMGGSDAHDSVYERDSDDGDDDDDERRVCEIVAVFELVPENTTLTVKHTLPRGNMIEEIAITCFGEEFIECSPGHAKGMTLFSCSSRHVPNLTRDKLASKCMTTFTKSIQTPTGVLDSDLLYLLLLIYESGLTHPSLAGGLVQALKQKLISFNAPASPSV